MRSLKWLESVVRNLDVNVVSIENVIGGPKKDNLLHLFCICLDNLYNKREEVEIRMGGFENTMVQKELVDYVIIIKQKFGVDFDTLVNDMGPKFSKPLSALLLPLDTPYRKLTNLALNSRQGEVEGNKFKKNIVDL